MRNNIMRSIIRRVIASAIVVDDRGQQRPEKAAPVPQNREHNTTSRERVCLDHRVDRHPPGLIEFLHILRHTLGCAPQRHLLFLSVSVFLAVASSPLIPPKEEQLFGSCKGGRAQSTRSGGRGNLELDQT